MIAAALFYLFAAVTAGGALGVVISRNIVRTAVCLLIALLGVAGIYFLLSAEFLAAVQLVVYVGGTLILIVFGVMLTSRSQFARMNPTRPEWVGAATVGLLILLLVSAALLQTHFDAIPASNPALQKTLTVQTLGVLLLGRYLAVFELASVVLLVVMIGSAYLARNRRVSAGRKALP